MWFLFQKKDSKKIEKNRLRRGDDWGIYTGCFGKCKKEKGYVDRDSKEGTKADFNKLLLRYILSIVYCERQKKNSRKEESDKRQGERGNIEESELENGGCRTPNDICYYKCDYRIHIHSV